MYADVCNLAVQFYNLPCSQVNDPNQHPNFIEIKPNDPSIPGCKGLAIRSYKTL